MHTAHRRMTMQGFVIRIMWNGVVNHQVVAGNRILHKVVMARAELAGNAFLGQQRIRPPILGSKIQQVAAALCMQESYRIEIRHTGG